MATLYQVQRRQLSSDRRDERALHPQSKPSTRSGNRYPGRNQKSSPFSFYTVTNLLQSLKPTAAETHPAEEIVFAADPWLAVPAGVYNHPRAFDPYPPSYHDRAKPDSRSMGSKASKEARQCEPVAATDATKSKYASRPKMTVAGQARTGGAVTENWKEMKTTTWVYGAAGDPIGKKTKKPKK